MFRQTTGADKQKDNKIVLTKYTKVKLYHIARKMSGSILEKE